MKRTLAIIGAALMLATAARAQGLFASDPAAQFSAEQAQRGQAAYARACLSCHGAALEGTQFGTPLRGKVFQSHWRGRTRAALSEKIRTTMPPGALGSVSGQAYTDIEAYILQANGGSAAANASSANASSTSPQPEGAPPGEPPPQGPPRRAGAFSWPAVQGRENDPIYKAAAEARAAKLAAITPVTDAMLANPPPSDWLIWRRTYDGLGYSPLKQINRSNVRRLRTAWSWTLPESQNETTPLIHDGVLFVQSGPSVQAVDAITGELLWQYWRTMPDEFNDGRGARAKTLAIYGDKVFADTPDGHVIALEARTGRVVWDQELIARDGRPAAAGLQLSSGPIVAKGKVLIGVSLGVQNGGGCFIVGLDAQTGKESWRFHTIARPGEPGGDTWNGAPLEERFGGGVWTAGSYDPELIFLTSA